MRNPFEVLKELKEKQEALIEHLKLEALLIPRHWIFRSKKSEAKG